VQCLEEFLRVFEMFDDLKAHGAFVFVKEYLVVNVSRWNFTESEE